MANWQSTGLTAAEAGRLAGVEVYVAELPGTVLGLASHYGTTIWIDADAAGWGWNLVEGRGSRVEGQEFIGQGTRVKGQGPESLTSSGSGPWTLDPGPRLDLLTVLAHELGHVIGREHTDTPGVMAAYLTPGSHAFPGERLELADHSDFRLPTSDFEIGQRLGERLGERLGFGAERLEDTDRRSAISDPFFTRSPLFSDPGSTSAFRAPTSDFRLPTSDFRDALFARLDDDAVALTGDVSGENDRAEKPDNEAEDGLDLWSLLYGLK
jgi:hypothetical protein